MGGFVVRLGGEPAYASMERRSELRSEIERAQGGDVDAYAVLVDHHAPRLHRLAASIVGADDAADATQEALLSAWRELPKLRDVERFEPWLRRILVNRCRKFLRGRSRRIAPVTLDPALGHDPIDPAPPVDARVAEQSALDAVFKQLSPDQRALLSLHYTMDLSIRESAAALGIRSGTAKSRLNKALAALRTALDPEVES
ncbi:MAG: RNA polymerase sigma factor [Candidatus Limnocylindria bacterium]